MELNTLEITEQSEVFEFASIRQLVNQALKKDFSGPENMPGISTGFKMLDSVTGGFQNGHLYTVAVKPGMGKTAFLLSVANNLAIKQNYSIGIFSSERSSEKITNRLIESETGMSLEKLRLGTMKASELDHMYSLVSSIAKAKIFLDDTPALSASELIKKSRQLKQVHNVDLIIIDYLELLSTSITDTDSRPGQLTKIVQVIKKIALDLDLPILLFSQISSPFGFVQKPCLEQLPESLSELSDSVWFVHRSDLFATPKNGNSKDLVELIVAKQNLLTEPVVVKLTFIESIAKFADFS